MYARNVLSSQWCQSTRIRQRNKSESRPCWKESWNLPLCCNELTLQLSPVFTSSNNGLKLWYWVAFENFHSSRLALCLTSVPENLLCPPLGLFFFFSTFLSILHQDPLLFPCPQERTQPCTMLFVLPCSPHSPLLLGPPSPHQTTQCQETGSKGITQTCSNGTRERKKAGLKERRKRLDIVQRLIVKLFFWWRRERGCMIKARAAGVNCWTEIVYTRTNRLGANPSPWGLYSRLFCSLNWLQCF